MGIVAARTGSGSGGGGDGEEKERGRRGEGEGKVKWMVKKQVNEKVKEEAMVRVKEKLLPWLCNAW